jgi:hypothetical protein
MREDLIANSDSFRVLNEDTETGARNAAAISGRTIKDNKIASRPSIALERDSDEFYQMQETILRET